MTSDTGGTGSTGSGFERFTVSCKRCGDAVFGYTGRSLLADRLRGQSRPTHCPKCRVEKARSERNQGMSYAATRRARRDERRFVGREERPEAFAPARFVTPERYGDTPDPAATAKFASITPLVEDIIDGFLNRDVRVAVLDAPTGTGKTVWCSQMLLRSPLADTGKILVTQPRLSTLRPRKSGRPETSLPGFVATELVGASGVGPGHEIGFEYAENRENTDRHNRLVFLTDGLLLTRIRSGELSKVSVLVIDEAHEESVNMTLLFWLVRELLGQYPRLRVVLASATVEPERFVRYFGGSQPERVMVASASADRDEPPKTLFTVHDRWPDGPDGFAALVQGKATVTEKADIAGCVQTLVKAIRDVPGLTATGRPFGNIVVFVPTVAIVQQTVEALERLKLPGLTVLEYHARSDDEALAAFQKAQTKAAAAFKARTKRGADGTGDREQYVVVTTTFGETGVTFADLVHEIDSGMVNSMTWDPEICASLSNVHWHHKAGCTQRRGRVGRVQDGEAWRLYTKANFDGFKENVVPQVQTGALDVFLLKAKAAGIDDIRSAGWLGYDPTDDRQKAEFERALTNLRARGCFDEDDDLSKVGLELARFQTASVDYARALRESDHLGCELEIATFFAYVESTRARPFVDGDKGHIAYARWRSGCFDDLEFYVRLVHHFEEAKRRMAPAALKEWCRDAGLVFRFFDELVKARNKALDRMYRKVHTPPYERALNPARLHPARFVIGLLVPEWIFVRVSDEEEHQGRYKADSAECPFRRVLTPDRSSACAVRDDVERFVCLGRDLGPGGSVVAKHVVVLPPAWDTVVKSRALDQAGVPGLVLTMVAAIVPLDDPDGCNRTAGSVRSFPPKPDVSVYTPGDEVTVRVLRFLEADKDAGTAKYLVEDFDSGMPFVVLSDVGRLMNGSVQVFEVVRTDASKGLVGVSRAALARKYYPEGTLVYDVVPSRKTEKGLEFDLEYGLKGFLPWSASTSLMDEAGYFEVDRPGPGLWPDERFLNAYVLRVTRVKKDRIRVEPVFRREVTGWHADGVVSVILGEKQGARFGVIVEIAPGVEVFVPRRLSQADVDRAEKGDRVEVLVLERKDRDGRPRWDGRFVRDGERPSYVMKVRYDYIFLEECAAELLDDSSVNGADPAFTPRSVLSEPFDVEVVRKLGFDEEAQRWSYECRVGRTGSSPRRPELRKLRFVRSDLETGELRLCRSHNPHWGWSGYFDDVTLVGSLEGRFSVGQVVSGKVSEVRPRCLFLEIDERVDAMLCWEQPLSVLDTRALERCRLEVVVKGFVDDNMLEVEPGQKSVTDAFDMARRGTFRHEALDGRVAGVIIETGWSIERAIYDVLVWPTWPMVRVITCPPSPGLAVGEEVRVNNIHVFGTEIRGSFV